MLRIALAIGFCIDFFVGPLVRRRATAAAAAAGHPGQGPRGHDDRRRRTTGRAGIYAFVFRDADRWRPLLWLCALDQTLGVVLPAIEIARGHAPATLKTLGPMPLQLLLAGVYIAGARRVSR